jgi:hypothetical protein
MLTSDPDLGNGNNIENDTIWTGIAVCAKALYDNPGKTANVVCNVVGCPEANTILTSRAATRGCRECEANRHPIQRIRDMEQLVSKTVE